VRKKHMVSKINHEGLVSALCYKKPRPIPMTETWTTTPEFVTCKKCMVILEEKK
jgi:hypothetical protein